MYFGSSDGASAQNWPFLFPNHVQLVKWPFLYRELNLGFYNIVIKSFLNNYCIHTSLCYTACKMDTFDLGQVEGRERKCLYNVCGWIFARFLSFFFLFFFFYIQLSRWIRFLLQKVAARRSERQDQFTKCRS